MLFSSGISDSNGGLIPQRLKHTSNKFTEAEPFSYDLIFTSMRKRNLIAPVFLFAVNRVSEGLGDAGTLTFGGLPRVTYVESFATAPIVPEPDRLRKNVTDPGFYSTIVDGIVYGSGLVNLTGNANPFPTLDTGTRFLVLPYDQAKAVNSLFSHPAVLDARTQRSVVPCKAIAPILGFQIGREIFYIYPDDLIQCNLDGTCETNVASRPGLTLLGIQFFWNTAVVFDVGRIVIRVAARGEY